MSTEKEQIELQAEPEDKKSLTQKQEATLDTLSSVAAVAGLSASVFAAVELSAPVMIIAAIAGAASAVTKLLASKYGSKRTQEAEQKIELDIEDSAKKNNTNPSQL